jgi:hypothetical protein
MEATDPRAVTIEYSAADEPQHHPPAEDASTDVCDTTGRIWRGLGGPISRAAMHARALRSRHDQDPQLRGELDALVFEFDGVFTAILHLDEDAPADASASSGTDAANEGRVDR